MFGLEYPELFFLLPLIFYCFYRCKEEPRLRYFVHLHFFSSHDIKIDKRLWYKFLTAFFLIFALASPVSYDPYDPKNREGVAMVLAMDASGSMNSSGFDTKNRSKSKFTVVKDVVKAFIKERLADNIGVVLFGDFAFIATPLTYEKEALSLMVEYLSLGMAGENTAIGDGIYESLVALQNSPAKSKIIILLTDGMHNSGETSPKEAVRLAKEDGVKIYTIGMGHEKSYDKVMLKQIAKESNGRFFKAKNKESLEEVYATIDTLETSKIRSRDFHEKEYWYMIPLFLSLIFFMLYLRSRMGSLS